MKLEGNTEYNGCEVKWWNVIWYTKVFIPVIDRFDKQQALCNEYSGLSCLTFSFDKYDE